MFSAAELEDLKREMRQGLTAQNPQEDEEEQSVSEPKEPAKADGTDGIGRGMLILYKS
jgi:hypothetical protein